MISNKIINTNINQVTIYEDHVEKRYKIKYCTEDSLTGELFILNLLNS